MGKTIFHIPADTRHKASTNYVLTAHLLAFVSVCIWGVTFVSTKSLISAGIPPTAIFVYRFAIAYVLILFASHSRLWADNARDEGLLCVAGLSGGSLYFITENTALEYGLASDVSLLICTSSLFTMLMSRIFLGTELRRRMIFGSFVALAGVALVVYNGSFNLGLSPLADALTLAAALLWAIYCVVLKVLDNRYSTFFVTRKVFFYGLLSAAIILCFIPCEFDLSLLTTPIVYANLLFLGVFASMLCYVMWSKAVKILGASKTANYVYCVPMVTILTAVVFLSEPFTIFTALGTILIIGGVILAEK